jgi:NHL repeat
VVAVDHAGNVVLVNAPNDVVVFPVRKCRFYGMPMTVGHYYLVAGTSSAGFSGDGGPATKAALNDPNAVAVDSAGNLLIADTGNDRVRVVAERTGSFYGKKMTAGDIYTVAGSGAGCGAAGTFRDRVWNVTAAACSESLADRGHYLAPSDRQAKPTFWCWHTSGSMAPRHRVRQETSGDQHQECRSHDRRPLPPSATSQPG